VANVAAAIRYIVARYGNITNVQQANANRPPAGYDSGGWLQPGYTLAYNGTRRPEPVLTGSQWNAVMAGEKGLDGMSLNVWIGNEKIHDIARAEVRDSQQRLIQVISAS
jgi:SLT domain-containing protein